MKRKDLLRNLLTPEAEASRVADSSGMAERVSSGAVRAMGLDLSRLSSAADRASDLERQIRSGASVVDIDPNDLEPSIVSDRLERTSDADYRQLVASLAASGQQIPILVRPHPEHAGRFQIAYGHRRAAATAELGIAVKAIIRPLTDAELVIAQGNENLQRRDLSFIERALFAAHLDEQGFDRATLQAALGVQSAEITRYLQIARAIPVEIVRSIGPAPRAGRIRWFELAGLLAKPASVATLTPILGQAAFRAQGSDRRFEIVLEALRNTEQRGSAGEWLRNSRGDPVIRVERTSQGTRVTITSRLPPAFASFIVQRLMSLTEEFEREASSPALGAE